MPILIRVLRLRGAGRSPLLSAAGVLIAVAVLFAAVHSPAAAQESSRDRGKWIDAGTPVSDDLRRVPVELGDRGRTQIFVLLGGRVFDGTGSPARAASVVVKGDRITAILPAGTMDWPANAQVIDVAGKTVMPGLIDLHSHLTYDEPQTPVMEKADEGAAVLRAVERLRYYLESGITSVRDVASAGTVPFTLKRWVADNRVAGPRIFAAGQLITATGGHGAEGFHPAIFGAIREASGPDDWREAVREQFKRGADLIKIASHFSREEISAAVAEAHALGLKVTVDAETFYIQWAVEAGVDGVEHPLPRTDETIRLMAKRHVDAVPTLTPYIYIFDSAGGYFGSTSRRFSFSKEANLEMLRRLKRAGVRMGIGTDLVSDWFRFLPQAYITELEQFVVGGYTIPEALVAATRTSAEILGMDDKLGTLAVGKLADVIAVDGRPDENLKDLAKISLVIRDGYVVLRNGRVNIEPHVPAPQPSPAVVENPSARAP